MLRAFSKLYLLVSASLILATHVAAEGVISETGDQTALSVTIYQQGVALVKDQRRMTLQAGENTLVYQGVSRQIRPETTSVASVSEPGSLRLLEQNYVADVVSLTTLLDAYLGKTVQLVTRHPETGIERVEDARIVAVPEGDQSAATLLEVNGRIESLMGINPDRRLVFPALPDHLRREPSLELALESDLTGEQEVALSYLSNGLNWEANYIGTLGDQERFLDLSGWISLTNSSGVAYNNAQLQLVAGEVNLINNRLPTSPQQFNRRAMVAEAAGLAMPVQEETLSDIHLYRLPRLTDVANKQHKQLNFFSATRVPIEKNYVLRGGEHAWYSPAQRAGARDEKVRVEITFTNDESSQLGIPLPRGVVRWYQNDTQGGAQFLGESQINHTRVGATPTFSPEVAFDVTATRTQELVSRQRLNTEGLTRTRVRTDLRLFNSKPAPVAVRVEEPIPGQWQVVDGRQPGERVGNLAVWLVSVPANGSANLAYEVEITR